jgi:hypothetical protein
MLGNIDIVKPYETEMVSTGVKWLKRIRLFPAQPFSPYYNFLWASSWIIA